MLCWRKNWSIYMS